MSEAVDTLMRMLRKEDYSNEEKKEQILTESTNNLYNGIKNDIYRKSFSTRKLNYECALAKEIICECVGNLYVSSLIIDDPEQYSDSLKNEMREQCMSIMESANTYNELYTMFEHSAPYVKEMLSLVESVAETKTDDDINQYDGKIFLNADDKKLIDKFEKDNGKDIYAESLQDRVLDVYKKEQERGEKRKEKIQSVIDQLAKVEESKKDGEKKPMSECVENGMNMFSSIPETLFNAIYVNKSKMIINESATPDLEENIDTILAETICTYTLLECISALGIKTYSEDEKRKLIYDFFIG